LMTTTTGILASRPAAKAAVAWLVLLSWCPLACIGEDSVGSQIEHAMDAAKNQVIDAEFSKADADHSQTIDKKEFEAYILDNQMVTIPRSKKSAAKFAGKLKIPVKKEHSFDNDPEVSEELKQEFDKIEFMGIEFWTAFVKSIAMIIATELGDKTFFIAAIMAMKHNRTLVYTGAVGALAVMTVLSVAIGFALPNLLPKEYTHYAAVLLFSYFGYKLLAEAYAMYREPPEKNEELEEVENELSGHHKKHDDDKMNKGTGSILKKTLGRMVPLVFGQAFMLTFLAEWGDRSQIATIALASSKDPFGVTVGGTLGHALCTGLAVIGGRLLATRISEQQVAFFGGLLFWAFALHEVWVGP